MLKIPKEQLIDAIKKNAGIVSGILRTLEKDYKIKVTRNAIYERKYSDPDVADAFTEAEETVLDVAENRVVTAVNSGERWAVTFYLKTKGRKRGYAERQEIVGADGQPIQITDPLADFSKEELMKLADLTDTTTNQSQG